jgi:hypothetical protein
MIVSILLAFFDQKFNNQREQWENMLKCELKLSNLDNKGVRTTIDGGTFPILSLAAEGSIHLPLSQSWKKAAQTYVKINSSTIISELQEDLAHGVRNFFFHKEHLVQQSWSKISKEFAAFDKSSELEVFLLGAGHFAAEESRFKLIDENSIASGRYVHELGGSNFQELGLLTCELIEKLKKGCGATLYLGVFTDSQFFKNIAKIRAVKLLAMKVLEECNQAKNIAVVAFSSYREWTFYERYLNMLRNDAAVASAYIAGADYIQSAGYNTIFELEEVSDSEHRERSRRMARNTTHILSLESTLGVVHDAAFGSFHLESLTQVYAQQGWMEMQRLLPLNAEQRLEKIKDESHKVSQARLHLVEIRKHVITGMNNYPDAEEKLNFLEQPKSKFFRVAKGFESLRLKMESLAVRPEVHVGILGDYATLNARLNFIKNYFQLLGLKVHEVIEISELTEKKDIVVLCGLDEEYSKMKDIKLQARQKFIASKLETRGFVSLFAGQNVYQVLAHIVACWESR